VTDEKRGDDDVEARLQRAVIPAETLHDVGMFGA
jgi:hypothetical protein